jgi:septum formation protein
MSAKINEHRKAGETARLLTRRLAEAKARAVVNKLRNTTIETIVIGADTIVEVKRELLGKPDSSQAARKMLAKLAGKTHRVVTSIAAIRLPDHAQAIATESTRVRFAHLSANEIAEYVKSGEPLDKAGAYGIQGVGGRFIEKIDGCYFNVVGLPLARLYRMLIQLGWRSGVRGKAGKATN